MKETAFVSNQSFTGMHGFIELAVSMLDQVKEECIMPMFRGELLEHFIKDCQNCSSVGQKNHHWFADAALCHTCAANTVNPTSMCFLLIRSDNSLGHFDL